MFNNININNNNNITHSLSKYKLDESNMNRHVNNELASESASIKLSAWVPPNDRELIIRAKLKTGWSSRTSSNSSTVTNSNTNLAVASSNNQLANSNSFMKLNANNNHNHLNSFTNNSQQMSVHQLSQMHHQPLISDAEFIEIEHVMQRANQIEKKELNRINKLFDRYKLMNKPQGNGETTCIICNYNFNLLTSHAPRICNHCLKNVCNTCSVDSLSPCKQTTIWLCRICAEYKDLLKKSGAWFNKKVPPVQSNQQQTDVNNNSLMINRLSTTGSTTDSTQNNQNSFLTDQIKQNLKSEENIKNGITKQPKENNETLEPNINSSSSISSSTSNHISLNVNSNSNVDDFKLTVNKQELKTRNDQDSFMSLGDKKSSPRNSNYNLSSSLQAATAATTQIATTFKLTPSQSPTKTIDQSEKTNKSSFTKSNTSLAPISKLTKSQSKSELASLDVDKDSKLKQTDQFNASKNLLSTSASSFALKTSQSNALNLNSSLNQNTSNNNNNNNSNSNNSSNKSNNNQNINNHNTSSISINSSNSNANSTTIAAPSKNLSKSSTLSSESIHSLCLSSGDSGTSKKAPSDQLGFLQFSVEYLPSIMQLKIHLICATNLPARDSNGLSDPYVKLHLLPGIAKATKLRSKTVYKNLNPIFNEEFHYDGVTTLDLDTKTLRLTVLDEDKFGFDFIGEYRLPLKNIQRNEINCFNAALDEKQELGDETDTTFRGKINFALKYSKKTSCLFVKINRCTQLLPMDNGKSSDPFVEICLLPCSKESKHHKFRSSTKRKTLDPEYLEEFKFENLDLRTLLTKNIEISVWDKDLTKNDFIGLVTLGQQRTGDELKHFFTVIKNPELYHEKWHTLHLKENDNTGTEITDR